MNRLILKSFQSPGDIVMLTAAVRELHAAYPGRYQTDVRTLGDAIWENNPHLTPLDEHDPEVVSLDMHYPRTISISTIRKPEPRSARSTTRSTMRLHTTWRTKAGRFPKSWTRI